MLALYWHELPKAWFQAMMLDSNSHELCRVSVSEPCFPWNLLGHTSTGALLAQVHFCNIVSATSLARAVLGDL